jgi:hypothetical protein
MGFTVDGPKGPKYVAKTGAVLLAKKTGNPIMPFVVETENSGRLTVGTNCKYPNLLRGQKFLSPNRFTLRRTLTNRKSKTNDRLCRSKLDEAVNLVNNGGKAGNKTVTGEK